MATNKSTKAPPIEKVSGPKGSGNGTGLEFPLGIVASKKPFIMFEPKSIDVSKISDQKMETLRGNIDSILKDFPNSRKFYLPYPNGGITDRVAHNWEADQSITAKTSNALSTWVGSKIGSGALDSLKGYTGVAPDPGYIQTYKTTQNRTWSCTYTFIPQSKAEADTLLGIIRMLKIVSAPTKVGKGSFTEGVFMGAPGIFKISFYSKQNQTGLLQKLLAFNPMALANISIAYFSNGYPISYVDGTPKQIQVSMDFAEFGLKYSEDWNKIQV